jgi:putative cardiolipin synthase
MTWGDVEFLHDQPGKNDGSGGLAGGGATTSRLAEVVRGARQRITIQSPYLVLPEGGLELLGDLVQRGVRVRISTNSLASTDNLQAFSGYVSQRKKILAAGIEVREFRPDPQVMAELIDRLSQLGQEPPVFAIHAKTLVVDGETLFVGTFNLDPRSANLNTEVGILIRDVGLAGRVETAIVTDMAPGNSWNPAEGKTDRHGGWLKRAKVGFWRLWPIEPLL